MTKLFSQFKLPLILAAIGAMLFALNAFMNTAHMSGANEQKVEHYEGAITQLTEAEKQRTQQASGDAVNVAEKLRRDNAIKKTFAEYRASLSKQPAGKQPGSKQPEELSSHVKLNTPPPDTDNAAAGCELAANDFSVLITAYQDTFGKQLATHTRSQPAPASGRSAATSRWHTASAAGVQPEFNATHSANAQQLQQPGNRSKATATASG